jgi:hypothetical protein
LLIQARSSGRKPEFFLLPFQFFRSISWRLELLQVWVHFVEKSKFGLLALLARRTTGKVAADDGVLAVGRVKAQFHIAAFGIEFVAVKANDHVARLQAGIDAHTRVTLFLGKLEVAFEAVEYFKLVRHVGCLGLHLLHANTIRLCLLEPGDKPFAGGGADAIEVEAG